MNRIREEAAAAGTGHAFAAHRLFAHLPRADQRRWAGVYLTGLLATPGKKSVRRMAASVTRSPTASQSLQQFVNVSPWQWNPVRVELARWIAASSPVRAWTLSSVVLPKRGTHAVGVHRRFVPGTGRSLNCQFAVGAFLSSALGDLSVDWQLYLPHPWIEDRRLRGRARIPDSTGYASTAALCLGLLDRLARNSEAAPPVVVDPEGQIDAAALIDGMESRGHYWIVAVPRTMPVRRPPAPPQTRGPGKFPAAGVDPAPCTVGTLVGRPAGPHRGAASPRQPVFSAVRTAVPLRSGSRDCLLVGEWTSPGGGPDRIWLSNLPRHRHAQAHALIASRAAARIPYAETESGLLDFAGRSYPGWHRHATLVSAACAQRRLSPGVCPRPGVRTGPGAD